MSDAAITALVSGLVTITTIVVGFLTLWVKLKYGAEKVDYVAQKLDANTELTSEAKDAAAKASEHADKCDKERTKLVSMFRDHDLRISALEVSVEAIKVNLDGLGKNLDSTRHELRGHLQTISTSIQLMSMSRTVPVVIPPVDKDAK